MNYKVAAITTTRGDRPKFLERCRYYVERQTVPTYHVVIDYPYRHKNKYSEDGRPFVDITERLYTGLKIAQQKGIRWAFVMEDDDWYPADYVERWLHVISKQDRVYPQYGNPFTYYLHVELGKMRKIGTARRKHASLHTAVFDLKLFDPDRLLELTSYKEMRPYTDNELFNKALLYPTYYHAEKYMVLSIKHDVGQPGGFGHNTNHRIWQQNKSCWPIMAKYMNRDDYNFYAKKLYK